MQYARFYIIGSLQLEDTFFALSTYKIRLYYDNKLYKIPELPPKLNLTSLDMCVEKAFEHTSLIWRRTPGNYEKCVAIFQCINIYFK